MSKVENTFIKTHQHSYAMAAAGFKTFVWERSDVERLVDWMVENQEALKGRKGAWVKVCKEQVFGNQPGVTTGRIGVKYNNLKASWAAIRKKIGGNGWEVRGGGTVDAELEEKYPFYQKLDRIFNTPPQQEKTMFVPRASNAQNDAGAAVARIQRVVSRRQRAPLAPALTPQNNLDLGTPSPWRPAEDSAAGIEPQSEKIVGGEESEGVGGRGDSGEECDSEAAPLPKTQLFRSSLAAQRVLLGASGRGKVLGRMNSVKRIMEECHSHELERDLKRMKIEREIQKERLESKERLARISASTAVEVAKLQAEAQVHQFELMAQMLEQRLGANGGANRGANRGPNGRQMEN